MWIIFRRELLAYFASPIAGIFLMGFLLASFGFFFFVEDFFARNQADMREMFRLYFPVLFTMLVPSITMRIWAEERRAGTEELLMTLPIGKFRVLCGKYLAAVAFLFVTLLLTFPIPATLAYTVEPTIGVDWGVVVAGYLGVLLLGAAYAALGSWLSSLTRHQTVAFSVTLLMLLALTLPRVLIGFIPDLGPDAQRLLGALSLPSYMDNALKGVVDATDLAFFGTFIGFFLFLNHEALLARRWR